MMYTKVEGKLTRSDNAARHECKVLGNFSKKKREAAAAARKGVPIYLSSRAKITALTRLRSRPTARLETLWKPRSMVGLGSILAPCEGSRCRSSRAGLKLKLMPSQPQCPRATCPCLSTTPARI
jgi:hypothetical protein